MTSEQSAVGKTSRVPEAEMTVSPSGESPPKPAPRLPLIKEMLVDKDWYRSHNETVRNALLADPKLVLAQHFQEKGQVLGLDPNPLFLLSHYLAESNFKNRVSEFPPYEDYLRNAGRLKASAHWLFDEARAQRLQPKLADAVAKGNWISAYIHFLRQTPQQEYSPHFLFNPGYYRKISGIGPRESAFRHFLLRGQYQGLSPHPLFDAKYYMIANGLPATGIGQDFESPLHHFIKKGQGLGISPIADFDAGYYLSQYPEVAEQVAARKTNAFRHFVEFGQLQNKRPNEYFSADDYVWYNPRIGEDIRELGLASPFEHYLAIGAKLRLRASRPLYRVQVPQVAAKAIFEQRARISAQLFCHAGIRFKPVSKPKVSFIIPVWNGFSFTMSILGQLKQAMDASPHVPAEIVVIDNGSSDQTVDLARYVTGVKLIRRDEQLGYLKACNLGAEQASGELLLFLNNDIELTPGLLDRVPGVFEDSTVGASGARIVGAAGAIQEAGCGFLRDGNGHGFGRGRDPTDALFLFPRDVDYVSGCFLCVRGELFRKIGGFDPRFSPGYYEDTDLCVQVRSHGYRVVYDPSLVIYHYEYASYSNGRPPRVSGILMRENHAKFLDKYRDVLHDRIGARDTSGHDVAFHIAPAQRPRRVLYIEDRIPLPGLGSGFTASADIVSDMLDAGVCVSVWSLHERSEMAFPLWRAGVQTLLPAIGGEPAVAAHLAKHGGEYDVVWVCRTHNFSALRDALLAWRGERKDRRLIVDTEALASTRQASLAEHTGDPWPENTILERVRSELPQIQMADKVVAKNRLDASVLLRACAVPAVVLGHKFAPAAKPPGPAARQGLLFVGAIYGENTPNYDSLRWFIRNIFPRIDAAIPGIEFHVAGYQDRATEPIESPLASQIVWHGPVTGMRPLFEARRVFVAPTRYAGGLPHKVQNALANGTPAVCTPLLWQQLDDNPDEPSVLYPKGWSPEEFADCVIRLCRDDGLWLGQQKLGLDYIGRTCSPARHMSTIQSLVND
jgi:O-antigen biosynthesis protein